MKHLLAVAVVAGLAARAAAVTIEVVPIGNPGNLSETNGPGLFGGVSKSYQIGKTEVSNAQYVEFLNAKATTDVLGLYNTNMGRFNDGGIIRTGAAGSYTYSVKPNAVGMGPGGSDYTFGDKPVNYVSWYDAIRFANWMNNGQGSASTETGAYTISGGSATPTNADSITRNGGATWFLPSENEWYKAAYYDGATATYSDYPTRSDIAPNNDLPSGDTGNSANYLIRQMTTTQDPAFPFTPVGAYTLTHSSYGTYDQGGNVAEWNEAKISAGVRGRRGGAWSDTASDLSSAMRGSQSAAFESDATGFRLATTATPAAVAGDYNGNGVVDAADYVVWRDHLGTSFQLTNEVAGMTPGTVTNEDYTAWRARFGNISGAGVGSGVSAAPVPEPTAMVFAILAAVTAACVRDRAPRTGH